MIAYEIKINMSANYKTRLMKIIPMKCKQVAAAKIFMRQ